MTSWQLDSDGRHLTLTDGCGIGRVKLIGSRELHSVPRERITRVWILRRADGHYAQFVLEAERRVWHVPTGTVVGIDVRQHLPCMDWKGQAVANPRLNLVDEPRMRRRRQCLSHERLRHQQGKHGKKTKRNHAARQSARHNRYPAATPFGTVEASSLVSDLSSRSCSSTSRPTGRRLGASWPRHLSIASGSARMSPANRRTRSSRLAS